MIEPITLPTFADFVFSVGPTRIAKVRAAKKLLATSEDYRLVDYWLLMRQAASTSFASGGDKAVLTDCVAGLDDAKKVTNYQAVAAGLSKFIGRKRLLIAGIPPRRLWESNGLQVKVRPDFVLDINGSRHVVMIHYKEDQLTQHKVRAILHLMTETHGDLGTPMIVEARTGKSFVPTTSGRPVRGLGALLESEALAFAALWQSDLEAA